MFHPDRLSQAELIERISVFRSDSVPVPLVVIAGVTLKSLQVMPFDSYFSLFGEKVKS